NGKGRPSGRPFCVWWASGQRGLWSCTRTGLISHSRFSSAGRCPRAGFMSNDDNRNDDGQMKDKLIRSKQQWAKEGRLLTGKAGDRMVERLPPGQRLVETWPVLDLGIQPHVPKEQ